MSEKSTYEKIKELNESGISGRMGEYFGARADKAFVDKYGSDFVKADQGKPLLSLIEPHFITSLGDILTFGAKKYSVDNWKLCSDTRRYKDALLRHTYAYLAGEILDPESGIEHTACMAFNTMALQWFDNNLKGQEND